MKRKFNAPCSMQAVTCLYEVGEDLTPLSQALINQDDIDQQSLAGAISTAMHCTARAIFAARTMPEYLPEGKY